MMKQIKKVFAVLLALAMTLGMTATAFAEEEAPATTYTITIHNSVEGHTYEAYQIFAGDLYNGKLSNIEWGSGVTEAGQNNMGKAAVKAEALKDENAAQFAEEVENYLTTEPTGTASTVTNNKYVISGLQPGYYLVKDKDNSLTGSGEVYTKYILKVVGDADVTPKADKPTSEKKVQDINDSIGTPSNWQDSADYDIGDDVPFQLTGTVAADYDNYTKYKFIFHDKESEGLTFKPKTVKVYVDNVEITTGFKVKTEDFTDDCTFEIVFDNLKDITQVHAGSKIIVQYKSELNESAKLGSEGNPNTMHLEYSNNPHDDQGGETGNTPDDTVIVFTFKVVINKVDKENKPLTGAEFKLEKYDSETDTWKTIKVVKNDDGTVFSFEGLDDGYYCLTETKTPNGYNSIDPIYFTVTAEHDVLSDNPGLTSLSGTQTGEDHADLTTGVIAKFTSNEDNSELSSNVVNNSGLELPETGGIGTTIFYVLGSILAIGAAILLVVKRRMSKTEK